MIHAVLKDESAAFLSTQLAGRRAARISLGAVLVSAAFFVAGLPFATVQLAAVPAFIPAYESALVICDLITAVLLFSQFNFQRSRALFVLACGYLFTAFIAFAHALTFPGVFAPAGLLGGGTQSTAWMYMLWHGGFPLFVIAYALLKAGAGHAAAADAPGARPRRRTGAAILAGAAAVLALVCGLTLAATANHEFLPVLILNNRFTPVMTLVVSGFWALSLLALGVLWRRRPHTVLDLWLMVVMCAWFFDIAMSAVFNAGRFDLGWYAGRLYGLLAASFVLIVLLVENGMHYARLVHLSTKLHAANRSLEQLSLQDALTELANRRFFDRYLGDQIAVARRQKRTLALVLCDIDAFKAYNDHYGHQAGDECLKRVAAAIGACCRRPADMAARYGGEEFAMILPDTELAGAAAIAEAARDAVAQLRIPHARSPVAPFVSISGGISVLLRKIENTAQQLISAADATLYQAKNEGRNRMVAVQAEPA
jgi:diguanylate cyclase (GGDEF)-like protein